MIFPIRDENPQIRIPYVTYGLIALNIVAWLALQGLGVEPVLTQSVCTYGLIPADLTGTAPSGTGMPCSIDGQPDWYTLLSAMFMHGSWMHLLGNMWFLWIFGNNVEDRLGHLPFLILYLAGGLLATACHVWMLKGGGFVPVVGASGAVAVVLGAYAVTYPFARVKTLALLIIIFTVIEVPAILVLGFWFLMQMAYAAKIDPMGGGVAWWAHIGGFAVGAILMPVLNSIIPDATKHERDLAAIRSQDSREQ